MSYSIEDPFVLYTGDYMLFRAAFVELVIRKVLKDNGFEHQKFEHEFDPRDPEGFDATPEAFLFLGDVFRYMGYEITVPDSDEIHSRIDEGKEFQTGDWMCI